MAYDKAKAHEYYINYVKKGLKKGRGTKKTAEEQAAADRKSTKGLNDAGKAAAKQIKADLQAERKEAYAKLSENLKTKIAALQERIKQAKAAQKGNKDGVMDLDSNAGPGDDIDALKAEIEQLRADTKAEKERIKADFDERYLQMLDELKADGDYKAVKKSKKGKGGKKK